MPADPQKMQVEQDQSTAAGKLANYFGGAIRCSPAGGAGGRRGRRRTGQSENS